MLDWLMEPVNRILKWLFEDIYQFFVDTFAYFVEVATLGMINFAIMTTEFAWDVAKQIMLDIGLSDALNQAWSTIPGDTVSILSFFGVPTFVSILLNALVTRWVLGFIPFTGK